VPHDNAHRSDHPPPGGHPSQGSIPDGKSNAGTYFLGRYRVVDEIGIGGMASVHLARMDGPGGFQKWVAIKRIHPHLVEDQTFIHMFLDAARISHPNVATVFDLGEHEDTYWIAMEYLHGEPLREVMRRTEEIAQPMPPEIACRVIADAAEGLHAAHELLGKNGEKLGLVHRDVTPHNLFVTYDGNTKVVDFGIAKFSSRMSSTRAGTLKGKLAYMSPEQVHGEGIDRRTDIFALAVVLWELTTGQRLFRMESDLDTLAKVQECNVPRPSSIVRGYPIDLEKIVMKALSKNRGERFKSAREFSRALQSLLMRRGLFIASDEVAAYMKMIFDERIKKREAHLRWAAEVTQTINIEGILTRPQPPIGNESSIESYNSEVQPAPVTAKHVAVRPAAGAPIDNRPPTLTNPTNPQPRLPQTPTIRPPARQKQDSHPASDEGPTLQASPQARAQMMEVALGAAATQGDEDDLDDNDDTIVTTTRIEGVHPMSVRTPPPAAGKPATYPPPATQRGVAPSFPPRENVAFAAPPRSVPPRGPAPLPLPAVVVAPPPPPPAPNMDQRSTAHVDALLAEALAEQRGHPPPPTPQVTDVLDDALRLPPPPAPYRANNPTAPRLFAPPMPMDLRTDTARQMKRPPPMWMVALGSGVAALIAAASVISFATWTSSRATTVAQVAPTALPVAPPIAPPAPTSTPHVIPATSGPFGSARAAFTTAITVTSAPAPIVAVATPTPPATTTPAPAPPANASAPANANTATSAPPPPRPAPPLPLAAAPTRAPRRASAPMAAAAGGDHGQLTIICFPACDSVSDNGSTIGPSPIFKRSVSVGEHRLKMTSSNPSATKIVSVIVMGDQTTTVRQPMTP